MLDMRTVSRQFHSTFVSRSFFWVVYAFACLVLTPTQHAQTESEARPSAYDVLKTAHWFTVGGVGIAGTHSSEELAFREFLKQPEPVARCKTLLEEATPAGQMYALLGLRQLDPRAFQAALPRYKESKANVSTASGCIVMDLPAANLARNIEARQYK